MIWLTLNHIIRIFSLWRSNNTKKQGERLLSMETDIRIHLGDRLDIHFFFIWKIIKYIINMANLMFNINTRTTITSSITKTFNELESFHTYSVENLEVYTNMFENNSVELKDII